MTLHKCYSYFVTEIIFVILEQFIDQKCESIKWEPDNIPTACEANPVILSEIYTQVLS